MYHKPGYRIFLTIFKMDSARCAWYSRSWQEWPTKKFIHKGALSTICLSNNQKSRFLGSIWLQTLPFFVSHKICFQAVRELLFHIVNKLTCLLWAFLKEGDERGQVFKLFFKWCCFCAIIARNTWIYNGEDVTFNQLSWPTKRKSVNYNLSFSWYPKFSFKLDRLNCKSYWLKCYQQYFVLIL